MSNFIELQKFLNSVYNQKNRKTNSLKDNLSFSIANLYFKNLENNRDLSRPLLYLCSHYGLINKALTLEKISELNVKKLTRERVRQIIDQVVFLLKEEPNNIYANIYSIVSTQISQNPSQYIRFSTLIQQTYFEDFKNNPKGLISIFNDCGFKQMTYRNDYFFYNSNVNKDIMIKRIQEENRLLRKNQTIQNNENKAKTVTYIPHFIKEFLAQASIKNNIGLNAMYERIFIKFMETHPYKDLESVFPKITIKTPINPEWEQLGLYVDKKVYEQMKGLIDKLRKNKREVSSMRFIAQSFIWYYNNPETNILN